MRLFCIESSKATQVKEGVSIWIHLYSQIHANPLEMLSHGVSSSEYKHNGILEKKLIRTKMVRENSREQVRLGLDPKHCIGFEKPGQKGGGRGLGGGRRRNQSSSMEA